MSSGTFLKAPSHFPLNAEILDDVVCTNQIQIIDIQIVVLENILYVCHQVPSSGHKVIAMCRPCNIHFCVFNEKVMHEGGTE